MFEIEKELNDQANLNRTKAPEIKIFLKKTSGSDERRYNLPRNGEIAVVFVSEDGEPPIERDLVVYSRGGMGHERTTINHLSPNCDPMVYPLLFPNREPGWRPQIDHVKERATKKRNKITLLQFYAFKCSTRNDFDILSGGKLFQQYAVDAYVKVETNNLYFIHKNQKELRVEYYQGLMDFINNLDASIQPGKVVILPSSFIVIAYLKFLECCY